MKPVHTRYEVVSSQFNYSHTDKLSSSLPLSTPDCPRSPAPLSVFLSLLDTRDYTTWHLWLKEKWTTILSTFQSYFGSITTPEHSLNISGQPVILFPCSSESLGLKTENYGPLHLLYAALFYAPNRSSHPVVSFPCSTESIGLKTENYSLLYFLYSTVISALIASNASIIHFLRRGNICPRCKHQFLCKTVLFSAQKQAEKFTCKWGN